ncbi:hypothetical protein AB0Q95_40565 [Streptomyces sp. NPDC059900]|uniref:hypothetical protein n=1 Tax=Streptomyces sp. NPDC059900 TaxID=3155816 RepID=UPI0034173805
MPFAPPPTPGSTWHQFLHGWFITDFSIDMSQQVEEVGAHPADAKPQAPPLAGVAF